jgi:hypothetical protein
LDVHDALANHRAPAHAGQNGAPEVGEALGDNLSVGLALGVGHVVDYLRGKIREAEG